MRAGFALQLVTVRWIGMFLEDPLDVPVEVLDFVAGQLEVADPSQVKRYTERAKTRFEHQWEIREACGLREFAEAEVEFAAWVAARSWTSGDGPKALSLDALGAETVVPPRRLGELARYGMSAGVTLIRRHPDTRRLATLLATVRHLEAKSVDDALELLDLLMTAELLNKAQTASDRDKARKHPGSPGRQPAWRWQWRRCSSPRIGAARTRSRACRRCGRRSRRSSRAPSCAPRWRW